MIRTYLLPPPPPPAFAEGQCQLTTSLHLLYLQRWCTWRLNPPFPSTREMAPRCPATTSSTTLPPPGRGGEEPRSQPRQSRERKVSMVESLVDGEEPIYSMPDGCPESDYHQGRRRRTHTPRRQFAVWSNRSAAAADEEHREVDLQLMLAMSPIEAALTL
ncbi:unconventional myosin-X [Lates japonicus]|uniref:Unconventional myosin-X n=1 Tax=Lates japonicus TaxID=270547 RepID=A0AAD3RIP2_LATJO|nr:unconventional myosin-X [Lates japonicus]